MKLKLIDIDFSHLSILGIALECGFNSEASFYRISKKTLDYLLKNLFSKQKTLTNLCLLTLKTYFEKFCIDNKGFFVLQSI